MGKGKTGYRELKVAFCLNLVRKSVWWTNNNCNLSARVTRCANNFCKLLRAILLTLNAKGYLICTLRYCGENFLLEYCGACIPQGISAAFHRDHRGDADLYDLVGHQLHRFLLEVYGSSKVIHVSSYQLGRGFGFLSGFFLSFCGSFVYILHTSNFFSRKISIQSYKIDKFSSNLLHIWKK